MIALVVTVVILAAGWLVNTALLAAVIRRLRRQGELLWEAEERGVRANALPPGSTVAPFTALDTDGEPLSDHGWAQGTMVGFFSPACGSCRRLRKGFRAAAAGWPGGRGNVIAVVSGPDATAGYAAGMKPVARIVVDATETVRAAFGVKSFPAIFVVDRSGRLTWTGLHIEAVPSEPRPPDSHPRRTDAALH